jgi:hypothetical protein
MQATKEGDGGDIKQRNSHSLIANFLVGSSKLELLPSDKLNRQGQVLD